MSGFEWVITGFYRVLLGFTGFYWVFLRGGGQSRASRGNYGSTDVTINSRKGRHRWRPGEEEEEEEEEGGFDDISDDDINAVKHQGRAGHCQPLRTRFSFFF